MAKRIKVGVAVIGAGTAGLTAQYYAQKEGATTLLLDPGPLGTTCARVGCMPSKLLIAAADAAHGISGAAVFGIRARAAVDTAKVMSRVRKMRDMFVGSMLEDYKELEKRKLLLRERACFSGPNELQAGGVAVEFKTAVVATGSVPLIPAPYREHSRFILTRENVFEQKRLPASMLVVGAGLIGLELGQALSRLGVRVTILGLDGLAGPLADSGLREEAIRLFSSGLDFVPDHELLSVKRAGGGVRVSFRAGRKRRTETFEKILIAAGQRPNLDGLGLENTGIPLDRRGRPVADPGTMRVGRSNIFLAGDADPFRPALHEAAFEGRVAGSNAARWPRLTKEPRLCSMAIAFTDPQMAVVGQSLKELGAGGCCGSFDFKRQGRALVMNAGYGGIRLYGEKKSGRVLGAEILGPHAEHLAHLLAWSVERRLTAAQMLALPFYHPVIEEGLQSALKDFASRVRGRKPCACGEHLPGA